MSSTTPSVSSPRREIRSESGSILVLTALATVVLLGIVALAVDGSYMYTERNRMAAAADAAAKAAAIEYRKNAGADLTAFANREVVVHGFDPGGATTVTVNRPPASGSYTSNPYYVEVIVSRPTATFFARILGSVWSSLTPGARAVAGTSAPYFCFIVNEDLSMGDSHFNMNGCDVGVGRNIEANLPGSHSVNAGIFGTPQPYVSATGTCNGDPCSGRMGNLEEGQPPPVDPLAGLASPPLVGLNCPAFNAVPAGTTTLQSGCYSSIPDTVVTLAAGGTFAVNGRIDITGHTLAGTGVLLHLVNTSPAQIGNIYSANPGGTLALTAANNADPYAGIAIYGDNGTSFDMDHANSVDLSINGVVYMPGTDVSFKNHLEIINTHCNLWIVKSFYEKAGNGEMDTSGCDVNFSNAGFLGVALAE